MINRDSYLQTLIKWKDHEVIKVITGVRRSGKSTLFTLYINYLKSQNILQNQIISVNLEDLAYEHLLDYKSLYKYITDLMVSDNKYYIFIDEVQNCKKFEKVVDSLFVKPNADVYITGSNAYMLSGELATLLSGRYVTTHMLPLSFSEYTSAVVGKNEQSTFNDYLKFGSFPYITRISDDEELVRSYMDGIYNTILVKDVARREGINDISLLESIIKTLITSIGSPISSNKIANTIISSGRKISVNTVDKYLKCLTDCYFFYKVDRYDIKGREHLRTLGKYYLVDTGIKNLLIANTASDLGHMIENVVFLELLRKGYKVSIGKIAEKEVDFVATRGQEMIYIQVSATVMDESTLERELAPLKAIRDNYPKLLITLDVVGASSNFDGILQKNLIDWLLMGDFD